MPAFALLVCAEGAQATSPPGPETPQTWNVAQPDNNNPAYAFSKTFIGSLGTSVQVSAYTAWNPTPSGFSYTAKTLQQNLLGAWQTGLGVGTTDSGVASSFHVPVDDRHTVDNSRGADVVVFKFSQPVKLSFIGLAQWGDVDARVWESPTLTNYNFVGKMVADLDADFSKKWNFPNTYSSTNGGVTTIDNMMDSVWTTYLVIAADPSCNIAYNPGSDAACNESFKINYISVPGPVAGSGLPALLIVGGWLIRRRRSHNRAES